MHQELRKTKMQIKECLLLLWLPHISRIRNTSPPMEWRKQENTWTLVFSSFFSLYLTTSQQNNPLFLRRDFSLSLSILSSHYCFVYIHRTERNEADVVGGYCFSIPSLQHLAHFPIWVGPDHPLSPDIDGFSGPWVALAPRRRDPNHLPITTLPLPPLQIQLGAMPPAFWLPLRYYMFEVVRWRR